MLRYLRGRRRKPRNPNNTAQPSGHPAGEKLAPDLKTNERAFRILFNHCSDVIFRTVDAAKGHAFLAVYVDGLIDSKLMNMAILKPLLYDNRADQALGEVERMLQENDIPSGSVVYESDIGKISEYILKGFVALIAESSEQAILVELKGYVRRSITEPVAESTIRGPHEGFIEDIRTNTSLLRRRLCTPNLKIEAFRVGEISKTDIAVAYIDGIVRPPILEEVKRRLKGIKIDGVLESAYIEEFIEETPFSPFPQIMHTERPDVVAAHILEGKVGIFTDGTPAVLIVPLFFTEAITINEDYYTRSMVTTAIRWIRILFFFMALYLPSVYIAIVTYHHEMLPTNLMLSIAAARELSPFPSFVETFIMEVSFEALREAGVRLPRPVGQAVSIVGALVIGQAAVEAGIVSAPTVIVVAMTGISSFTIPKYNIGLGIRLIRFPMMFAAGILGLYGIIVASLLLLAHLCSLRSFGAPYFSPIGPFIWDSFKNLIVRVPWWAMHKRPATVGSPNKIRVPKGQRPDPS